MPQFFKRIACRCRLWSEHFSNRLDDYLFVALFSSPSDRHFRYNGRSDAATMLCACCSSAFLASRGSFFFLSSVIGFSRSGDECFESDSSFYIIFVLLRSKLDWTVASSTLNFDSQAPSFGFIRSDRFLTRPQPWRQTPNWNIKWQTWIRN